MILNLNLEYIINNILPLLNIMIKDKIANIRLLIAKILRNL